MTIRCEIVSQDRLVYEGDADMIIVPGKDYIRDFTARCDQRQTMFILSHGDCKVDFKIRFFPIPYPKGHRPAPFPKGRGRRERFVSNSARCAEFETLFLVCPPPNFGGGSGRGQT